MAPRRESAAARAQGKRPATPTDTEARRKARFDTSSFASAEEYQRFKSRFAKRAVTPGRDIDFGQLGCLGLAELFGRMGWLPIVGLSEPTYPTLVRIFYSRMRYCVGGPITCSLRGHEIRLDAETICQILEIPAVGLRLYELKSWPTIPGFDAGVAVQRLCGLAEPNRVGRPSASGLTVISRVLHHMICYSLVPRGGHRDEVSYFDGFLIDSILTGRRLHLGHIMMHHMMACCEGSTRSLPYGRFLTKVFKEAGIDLSTERDFDAPSRFDTYGVSSLRRMGFEQSDSGEWIRKPQGRAPAADDDEEDEIRDMEGGVDPQAGDAPILDIPPLQSEGPFPEGSQFGTTFSAHMGTEPIPPEQPFSEPSFSHAPPPQAPPTSVPWSDFSAQISSLSSRLGDFSMRFTSVENRLDHFDDRFDQVDARFPSFEQRFDHYETISTSQFARLTDQCTLIQSQQAHLMDQHAQIQAQQSQLFDQYAQIQTQQSQLLDQQSQMMELFRSVFPPPPPQP